MNPRIPGQLGVLGIIQCGPRSRGHRDTSPALGCVQSGGSGAPGQRLQGSMAELSQGSVPCWAPGQGEPWFCASAPSLTGPCPSETGDPDHAGGAGGAAGERAAARLAADRGAAAHQHPQHQPGALPPRHHGPVTCEYLQRGPGLCSVQGGRAPAVSLTAPGPGGAFVLLEELLCSI